MQVQLMITNGGPHPADAWARASASQIMGLVEVDPASTHPDAVAARKTKPRLELDLADELEAHHAAMQAGERERIKKNGNKHVLSALEAPGLDDAVKAALGVLKLAPAAVAKHFEKPEVIETVRRIIGQHFANVMHIERSWHADRNQDCPHCAAFRRKQSEG